MSYAIAEIFYSLQGEGLRAGTAAVFVRFAGCNLKCSRAAEGFDCDTDFSAHLRLELEQLVQAIRNEAGACRWIVMTGGEPALQLDQETVDRLHAEGFKIAVETNGTLSLPRGLDWVTVSPKPGHMLRESHVGRLNEVKIVVSAGERPEPCWQQFPVQLSPAFRGLELDRDALAWCIKLVKENPQWRLSVQQHKLWNIP